MAEWRDAALSGVEAKETHTGSNPVLTTKNINMKKLVSVKILRPITLTIIGIFLISYIIIAYVFDLEM